MFREIKKDLKGDIPLSILNSSRGNLKPVLGEQAGSQPIRAAGGDT